MSRLDDVAGVRGRLSDFGEIASRALARTLVDGVTPELPGLFTPTSNDVQLALRRLSYSKGIAAFSRIYFGNLISAVLSYWLDRTLSLQVGENRRFDNVAARSRFDAALGQYTSECTRIIQEFAGGWYGKTLHEVGGFGRDQALRFGAVALKKISEELRTRWPADD